MRHRQRRPLRAQKPTRFRNCDGRDKSAVSGSAFPQWAERALIWFQELWVGWSIFRDPSGASTGSTDCPHRNWRKDADEKIPIRCRHDRCIASPAFADDVGVHVGPAGAGATVGESHDRDRDRDRTTVVKEHEPSDRTTVIKKEDADGDRTKTVIHHDN